MADLEETAGGSTLAPSPEALAALLSLAEQGVDPLSVLDLESPPDDLGTREGEAAPGTTEKPGLRLAAKEKELLESELCDLLDRYDVAMGERWEQEQEVRDNYAMIFDSAQGGYDVGSAQMVSEMTMALTDQAAARISNAITHADPLIRTDPVYGSPNYFGEDVATDALLTERFFNEYVRREVDLLHLIPPTILRTTKVGQAVWYITWEEENRTRMFYTDSRSTPKRESKKVGNVRVRLIDNRNIKVWPPTLTNWQRDYVFVGHEAFYTKGEWLRMAQQWGLDADAVAMIEQNPGEATDAELAATKREGIDQSPLDEQKLLSPLVRMTQLWCHMVIPGRGEAEKFYVFLHRPTRKITFADYNPNHTQKHGYFPIPYKVGENSAWATGVGQEVMFCHAADTAMRCLEQDNLMAGAFYVQLCKAGEVHNTNTGPVRPGHKLIVDDVEKSFETKKMGGEAPELQTAKRDNQQRSTFVTGMAPVLSGHGDPTMKSGAGTGSTLALIEQANIKIRNVEKNVHTALSDAFTYMLELVQQYAPDGLFYRFADESDAKRLRLIRYVPPRGDLSEIFNLRVEAPSAATSDEVRRQSYMLLWTFALQHCQAVAQWAIPVLQQENPAAIPRFMRMIVEALSAIARRVAQHVEIPDVPAMLPTIPEPTPQDDTINQLNGALQQAHGQIEQLLAVVQQATGQAGVPGTEGGAMPPTPEMPAMPPEGMVQ